MKKFSISVVINTYNEEKNIRYCLESVKWADEIIIVDMYSTDKTIEIAKKYTDKIYFHERVGYAEPARQFAVELASNNWIFVIDADEIVTKPLRDKIIEIVESNNYDVVYVPRINYIFGKPINKNMFLNPYIMSKGSLIPRLFKKGYVHFNSKIHDFCEIQKDARIYKTQR